MTRARFQKILIAAAYLVYLLFFFITEDVFSSQFTLFDFLQFTILFGFLFIALPALFALFLHLMFYSRISYAGAFIIIHWSFILSVAGYMVNWKVEDHYQSKTVVIESDHHIEYEGAKKQVENDVREYVKVAVLPGESHVIHFIQIYADTTEQDKYQVYYFYTLGEEPDTSAVGVLLLDARPNARVSLKRKFSMNDDEFAANMFHSYFRFMEWTNRMSGEWKDFAASTSKIDSADLAIINEWMQYVDKDNDTKWK